MADETPPSKKTTRPRKKPAPAAKGGKTAKAKPSATNPSAEHPFVPDPALHAVKSDMKESAWIMAHIPESFKPYALLMRLDRPIGIWLLLLPCYWGLAAGMSGVAGFAAHMAIIPLVLAFTVGAILMRGAGCVINDLWDKEIDAEVERTKSRPLVSGAVTSEKAMIFLGFLIFISAMILFSMNMTTIALGILGLAMAVLYPLMKRMTFWPQAFLGLTFNIGILMGCAALTGGVSAAAFLLYLGAIAWTIAYDTIYARQDIEDDMRLGMKSTAILFGDNLRLCVIGFMIIAIGFFIMAGVSAGAFGTYYAILALPTLHAFLSLRQWDENDPASCLATFKAQRDFALLVLLALFFI